MWWKYLLEGIMLLVLLMSGNSFWSLLKAPFHLKTLLNNLQELERLIEFLDPIKLKDEAQQVEPVFGTFRENIELWHVAHMKNLNNSRNMTLLICITILVSSYFMGISYLVINSIIFLLPSVFPIVSSAKNNNATHIHTIILNIYKWNTIAPDSCNEYCTEIFPDYKYLYLIVASMD